ncbi:N-6 DNA methylase [Acidovorax sp. SDU_ACID1]|uniref:N-6 DNA methylase n=1 Tax=Acidovorax sp. SDU_ACID1 TaxID=3136632 RepID=UPI0038736F97
MAHKTISAPRGPFGADQAQALVKLIQTTAHRWGQHEVFSDFVELAALSISNAVDRRQAEPREARYLEIAKKYSTPDFERFPQMLGHLTLAMEACGIVGQLDDVLGRIYMQLELGNERAGQVFTPYHVSRMMAMLLIGDGAQAREKGFIDVMEPACGAGGMVIAMADALRQAGLNYQNAMHASCIDIDARCVHMTYLQASLLHIPATVLHGNSLSGEVWSRWYTPAHMLGGWRARLHARRLRDPAPVVVEDAPAPALAPVPATDPARQTHRRPSVPLSVVQQLSLFEE